MRLPAFLAGLLLVPGCSLLLPSGDSPRVCTEEFRTYTVQVVDAEGKPVNGLDATAVVVGSGAVLAPDASPFPKDEGRYPVATDADRDVIGRGGDTVRFSAEGGGLSAEALFTFFDDGCHVIKRSGPEQIVAAPLGD